MTNEEYILDWYKNHIWTRPAPSKVCDGVGMFAIRDIPKGTSIFDLAEKSVWGWIPWEQAKTIPRGLVEWCLVSQPQVADLVMDEKKLYDDFFNGKYESMWAYTNQGMNWQTNWFFVNHSYEPNVDTISMKHPRKMKYVSNRDIKIGEEILEDYNGFTETWKLDI